MQDECVGLAWEGPYCPFIHACDDRPRQIAWSIPQRRLAHYLLSTSLLGSAFVRMNGHDHVIPSGGSYVIPPGALTDVGSIAGNTPVWVHFDVQFAANRAAHPHAGAYESELHERSTYLQPSPLETWGIDIPIIIPPALTQLFRDGVPRLVRRWKEGGPIAVLDATTQLSSLLTTLISHVYEASSTSPNVSVEARIARAETMALRSLDSGIDVEDLAATAGYSRTRFSALYQQIRGKSPGAFLREERLRLAENLLSRPELPIAKVGALVGYPDPTVFGRFFRSHHQISPGEWRKRNGY